MGACTVSVFVVGVLSPGSRKLQWAFLLPAYHIGESCVVYAVQFCTVECFQLLCLVACIIVCSKYFLEEDSGGVVRGAGTVLTGQVSSEQQVATNIINDTVRYTRRIHAPLS